MNVKALNWYRQNSNYTENSGKVGKIPIQYFDMQTIKGGRNRYQDIVSTGGNGMDFFGTPGEYSARFKTSKYLSVMSSPDKGKIMFVDYPSNGKLTKRTVFPGVQSNGNNMGEASPFHMIKLYFPGRASLALDTNTNSANYKNWN
jgi:hypothetical protein|tara:strand:+ start:1067 stop:1501 length:435 start_codon:yes stop_codon:yes gene_type:complete